MHSAACMDNNEKTPTTEAAGTIRIERVLRIRRQLGAGRYGIAERVDIAVDRLLEDLLR